MYTELAYEAQKTLIKERSNTALTRRAQRSEAAIGRGPRSQFGCLGGAGFASL